MGLSLRAARQDLEFLIATVRDVHPALSEASKADEFELAVDAARHELNRVGRGASCVYRIGNRLIGALHDGHTALRAVPGDFALPIRFAWTVEGLVVAESHIAELTPDLSPVDEVEHINSRDSSELAAVLRDLVPHDNRWWWRARGPDLLRNRLTLLALGVVRRTDHTVCLGVKRERQYIELRLPLLAPQARAVSGNSWFDWHFDASSRVGVFRLDKCVDSPRFRTAVERFFAEAIALHSEHIAFDVRHNTGGDSRVLSSFLAHIASGAIRTYWGSIRYSRQACQQRGYSATDRSRGGRQFQLAPPPFGVASTPMYEGRVSVLTSGHTFSSGAWLAVMTRDNKLANTIGEPTGSAPSSYGDPLWFQLPRSKLLLTVSHMSWRRPDVNLDPAVTLYPDVYVPVTSADLRLGRNPARRTIGLGDYPLV